MDLTVYVTLLVSTFALSGSVNTFVIYFLVIIPALYLKVMTYRTFPGPYQMNAVVGLAMPAAVYSESTAGVSNAPLPK